MITSGTEKGTADNLATRLGLAPGTEAVSTLERQVTGERVRLMAERSTHESALAALFALAAVALLWSVAEPLPLLTWLVLTQIPSVARLLVERCYRRIPSDVRTSRHPYWARRFSACSAASGVAWGGIVVLVPSAGSAEVALLVGLHAAYLAFAAGILTAWLPAFLGFALSSTLAFLAFALIAADALSAQSAVLLIVAGAGSSFCAHGGARSLIDTLRARLEGEERVVRLVAERERAELALDARGRLLAAASHDLRQPVLALDLYAGSLRSKVRGTEADAVAARIQQSIGSLSALIDSVLDVSTPEANGAGGAPSPVALGPLLTRVVLDHELQARAKGLSLSIEGQTDLIARVDPVPLARVLMNLLGNAIKFTEHGGVVVAVRPVGERVSLSVRDTGRGIAEGERQRVFAEYHQSRRADRAAGQGLGLAIVKRLCDRMGVSIDLFSAPGAGSEFRLSIPRGTADEAGMSIPPAAPAAPPCPTALVIDDERGILDGTRALLAERGCRPTVAGSAIEAPQRYAEKHAESLPNVLIVDIERHGLEHGLDAVRCVREEFDTDVPALLVTGDSTAGGLDAMVEEGVRVLRRPYSPERLHRALVAPPAPAASAGFA